MDLVTISAKSRLGKNRLAKAYRKLKKLGGNT